MKALSVVCHPHLATILGFVSPPSDDDLATRLSLVLPVFSPTTLEAWMPSLPRDSRPKQAIVLSQVAKGVAFLHARGIVHGALDATTVLIEDREYDGYVFVCVCV